ncbi:MAG: hypothetical protein O9270_10645 [Aquidulcibacter sp.]|jgi:hypothetical protein|uniref:hypothetical protein n=1 Tax=Aquidulcibacter sp. TaxID=2052990 RepID=UPI0022C6E125|nr:hypothetical protein [Aquidulcibacter sp.]MCE2890297.1 hypothetical protein [Hyphomonadaceae bacterium]MCZ8208640.1 hypothetical protein [Aquidulcibacter sp.]
MARKLVALTAVSLMVLSGCATSVVSSSNVAETAAIDRDMPRSGKSPYGALPALEANPTPVRLEP